MKVPTLRYVNKIGPKSMYCCLSWLQIPTYSGMSMLVSFFLINNTTLLIYTTALFSILVLYLSVKPSHPFAIQCTTVQDALVIFNIVMIM